MPFVEIKLMEGALPDEERAEMIKRVTDAVVSVYGEGLRPVTWVVVQDVRSGEWGVGGNLLSAADVQALRGDKAKQPVPA